MIYGDACPEGTVHSTSYGWRYSAHQGHRFGKPQSAAIYEIGEAWLNWGVLTAKTENGISILIIIQKVLTLISYELSHVVGYME